MSEPFPYDGLPETHFWRRVHSDPASLASDPQGVVKWQLDPGVRVASAGSCFASRIAEHLQRYGFDYVVTEPGPSWLDAAQRSAYNYGRYSFRCGDVFVVAQMAQLLQRALGRFVPLEDVWRSADGTYLDPFRPVIQPGGFASLRELHADRRAHLDSVRRAFEQADLFIYTLGLTEAWVDRRDNAILPFCPGRGRGKFDPELIAFHNFCVDEVSEHLESLRGAILEVNPELRTILTVSPVPLAATLEGPNVMRSTVYSKSILRVAAERLARAHDDVDYFASYEIVLAGGFRPPFFAEDGRTVTEAGVYAVMRSFYRNYFGAELDSMSPVEAEPTRSAVVVKPCDEELLLSEIERDFERS